MARLSRQDLDPMQATSYGTGELILAALESGCRSLFLGLGGSATSDAGAGILQALGVELLDRKGRQLKWGAASLKELSKISLEHISPRLRGVELLLGCDVENTLYGPEGAAYIYAPQKGALPEQLPLLDEGLRHFASVVKKELGVDIGALRGGGAAGGIGAGLAGVLGAKLVPGAEEIMEIVGLRALLESGEAGLVITGGQINAQSLYGKVPVAVSRMAKRWVPVLVLAGGVKLDLERPAVKGLPPCSPLLTALFHWMRPWRGPRAWKAPPGALWSCADPAVELARSPIGKDFKLPLPKGAGDLKCF